MRPGSQMNLEEYSRYDALRLAGLVKRGEVSAKELARTMLSGVEKVNSRINAVVETYSDRVEALDDNVEPKGPFAGVPFLMKDLGATEAGKRQERGCRLFKGWVAEKDSYLTIRFKQAGLTLLGRTTTPELGLALTTESVLTGQTCNPWNPEMLAGGSSGGAAACVATGILPVAHASDGGGSIRLPASACGLVGLKPSRGRVTQGSDFGERLAGMAQEFIISRTVRDTAVMLDAVSHPAPGDPFVIIQPERPYAQEVNAPAGRLRIAWTTRSWQPGTVVHPEVARCIERVAAECSAMGHEVSEGSPTFDYEEYLRAQCVAWAFGADVGLDSVAVAMGREINDDTLEPVTLSYYRFARHLAVRDMIMAEEVFNRLRRNFGGFFQRYNVLLTPTLAQPPEPLGEYSTTRPDLDFVSFFRLSDETGMYTPLPNVTGQPAISLPLGQSDSGLPIGAHFIARFGDEATLIRIAAAFEEAMPWADRIPLIHVSR